jgi:hypothetical protein
VTAHHEPAGAARGRRTAIVLGLVLAGLLAGCAARDLPGQTSVTGPPAGTPPATEDPSLLAGAGTGRDPARSAGPVTLPPPAVPPAAVLAPADGDGAPGDLGGYTWAGAGSDAPWLVPPPERAVKAAGPYTLVFDPPLEVVSWTARWAPVTGDTAGDPAGWAEGGAGVIVVDGPGRAGAWSLQLDARFAGGGRAAWYWRLESGP